MAIIDRWRARGAQRSSPVVEVLALMVVGCGRARQVLPGVGTAAPGLGV